MTFFERINIWARKSVTLKLISIGILVLILQIPSSMITKLIHERQNFRDEAIDEVSSKWGSRQLIGGPVLTVPYKMTVVNQGKSEVTIQYAHFLPDKITMEGIVSPEQRSRGIYVVVLYNAKIQVKGNFAQPNYDAINIASSDMMLADAFIQIGITDMKGIKKGITLNPDKPDMAFNPGIETRDLFPSGVSFPIDLTKKSDLNFNFSLDLNGSTSLNFLPLGKETTLQLKSTWANPSFQGAFLPDSRKVTDKGFLAFWKVLQLNRNYPQQGTGRFLGDISDINTNAENDFTAAVDNNYNSDVKNNESAFGVKLILPIDEYQKTLRSAKYDLMFIILTFIVFFFVEILNKKRIHAIQYLIVGFAITLFYILLLSLSEHLTFDYAYLVSCICILLMVTFYSKAIFKSNFLTAIICGVLIILYGFFYSILQLQDYSLLLGSVGLVIILGTIMYLTRNINWYNTGQDDSGGVNNKN